jgi:hypothetical protein
MRIGGPDELADMPRLEGSAPPAELEWRGPADCGKG